MQRFLLSLSFCTALLSGASVRLLAASAEPQAFLFPEAPSAAAMNRRYGEAAMAERLYKNAIRYFTQFWQEAATPEEKAAAAQLLSKAFLLDGDSANALKTVNAYLESNGEAKQNPIRSELFLTAAEASNNLKDHATALNFLAPLLAEDAKAVSADSALYSRVLCTAADAWNATGRWQETTRRIAPVLEKMTNNSAERVALAWRYLNALVAQGQWQEAQNTLSILESMAISESEKTLVKLLRVRCDLGEGKTDRALQYYRDANLGSLAPTTPSGESADQWLGVLSSLAHACQAKGLHRDAAELFGVARKLAATPQAAADTAKLQAESLIAVGEYPEARRLLLEVHDSAPNDTAVTLRLAEVRKTLQERRGAAELFLSLANNAQCDRPLRYRAAMEAAQCLALEGLATEATPVFRLASELAEGASEQSDALRKAAEQSEKNGKTAEAVALYRETAERFGALIETALEARLEAGRLLLKTGDRSAAIKEFEKFLQSARADSPLRWNAQLEIGMATAEDAAAVEKLLAVARQAPDASLVSQAYFEAHARALLLKEEPLARGLAILQEFLQKCPDVDAARIRLVRHRNICLGFEIGKPEALVWGREFLQEYPEAAETPEVALRLGDALADDGNAADAAAMYRRCAAYPQVSALLKDLARYEEAVCLTARFVDGAEIPKADLARAQELLSQLRLSTADAQLRAKAVYLQGDLFTRLDDPVRALEAYTAARTDAANTPLGYAALGRLAEIHSANGRYAEAAKCLDEILRNAAGGDHALRARAKLLRARCSTQAKDIATATRLYQEIRLEYETARRSAPQVACPPNVYVAAVCELLEILDAQHDETTARIVRENYRRNPSLPPLP